MKSSKNITEHANRRMHQRGIREDAIAYAINNGRKKYTRGCITYFVGKKEVDAAHNELNGLHVLVSCEQGSIITAYKSKSPKW